MKPSPSRLNSGLLLCLSLVLLFSRFGYAQEDIAKYPNRPLTLIFPYSAGVTSDVAFRLMAKEAEKFLGQPIVVVNKPGGSGTIGVAALAAAKPDGYTIGQTGSSAMFMIPFFEKVPYHPVNDFKQIIQFKGSNFGVIVNSNSRFDKFQDLIAYARQNPRKLHYGTAGANNMAFIAMELIAKKEQVHFTNIPFKATSDAEMALLGDHIHFAAGDFTYSLLEAKKIKLLMVLKEEHSEEYPKVPILKDLGYGHVPFPSYASIAGPRGLPEGIVKKLEDAFTKAMREPAFIKGMKDLQIPVVYRNSKGMEEYVAHNYELFGKLLKEMGLTK